MTDVAACLIPAAGASLVTIAAGVVFRELGWHAKHALWWLIIGSLAMLSFAGLTRWSPSIRPLGDLLLNTAAFPGRAPSRWSVLRIGMTRASRAHNQRALTKREVLAADLARDDLSAGASPDRIYDGRGLTPLAVAQRQMTRVLGLCASCQAFDRRARLRCSVATLVADHIAQELGYSNRARANVAWTVVVHQLVDIFERARVAVQPVNLWFGSAARWLGPSWHEPSVVTRATMTGSSAASMDHDSTTTAARIVVVSTIYAASFSGLHRGDSDRRHARAWRDIEALSGNGLDSDLVALLRMSGNGLLRRKIDRVHRRDSLPRRAMVTALVVLVTFFLVAAGVQPPSSTRFDPASVWPIFG